MRYRITIPVQIDVLVDGTITDVDDFAYDAATMVGSAVEKMTRSGYNTYGYMQPDESSVDVTVTRAVLGDDDAIVEVIK